MDSMNAFEIIPGPSVAECITNSIDEDSTRKPQADEAVIQVSKEISTKTPKKSELKSFKQPAKVAKPSLKREKPTKDELPLKRKKANSLPISQMVMESIKALRKRNGASVEAILEHMEGQYKVNVKLVKRHVSKFLMSAVQKGIVEQLSGAGNDGKFKIKKAEKITKVEKKLNVNQRMIKTEKCAKTSQKLTDNQKMKAKKVAKVEQNSKPIARGEEVTKDK